MAAADDLHHMRAALALARRGLGNTWPNPSVGCVIVREGRVVGRGWTQPGGRPHAETEALARAGEAARGATAYVTLEPCSHWGRTPPCCDALIAAGVARVVVATGDPDPRVDGRGLAPAARGRGRRGAGPAGSGGARRHRRLRPPHHPRPAAGHPEARHHPGRPHRHRQRRKPLDHRRRRAPGGARPPRQPRRGAGRQRHGAGRRPGPHLPRPRHGPRAHRPGGGRHAAAHAARRPPGPDRPRRADLDRHPHRPEAGGAGALPRSRGRDPAGAGEGERARPRRPARARWPSAA